ncbi:MAG: NUDIX domain-containing protein [archaeon]
MEEKKPIKYEKSAGAIIYYNDSKIKFLLLKYKTYWGFAKGWIEQGETIEETVKREVFEETGLNELQIDKKFKHIQKWFFRSYEDKSLVRKEAIYLLAKISKEQASHVKISIEHEDFIWLEYEEALKKMKVKQNKEMLKKAYDYIKKLEVQQKIL